MPDKLEVLLTSRTTLRLGTRIVIYNGSCPARRGQPEVDPGLVVGLTVRIDQA